MYSSVTWLNGSVTIRVEWPGGMYDNGFLRGWGIAYQPVKVKDLQLSPLVEKLQSVQDSNRETCCENVFSCTQPVIWILRNCPYFPHFSYIRLSVVFQLLPFLNWRHFNLLLVTSRYLKHFAPRQQGQEWLFHSCLTFFHLLLQQFQTL